MQEQNFHVSYVIDVEATQGTRQVMAFADAVSKLTQAKASFTPAVENIKKMMSDIDAAFRTKDGKRRDYSYKMNIDTGKTEEKLTRVKGLLSEIKELSRGINLVINAGQPLDSNKIKANAKALYDKTSADARNADVKRTADESVKSAVGAQKDITKIIGKINSAMVSLERGREVNIKTDVAKQRLSELLGMLNQLRSASRISVGVQTNTQGAKGKGTTNVVAAVNAATVPFAPEPYMLPEKVANKLQEKLYTNRELQKQRIEFAEQDMNSRLLNQERMTSARNAERQRQQTLRNEEAARKRNEAEELRREREAARRRTQNAAASVRNFRQQSQVNDTLYGNRRRAAINRLQYARTPSLRSLPLVSMFNTYMAYSFIKSELGKAVEYGNIMESARSILRVADSDLSTFEFRFDQMSRHVRQIGIETKFTAVEIAGATKYLAMAGMGIDTINKSIRPIANLALIGDNDVSLIADLATNIMSGYDIKSDSMVSVADILSSTVSRSNVNVVEMAESYKMAAGYLRVAGVDFAESAAAIGVLGNMGIKGTMAGTSLRAMATRFAKPTKEARASMDRLGIKFTQMQDVYGKQVERLRPIADIFEELNNKGASMADMQAIFGKIGGNAAMMFVKNYDRLRELSSQNKGSYGISSDLAQVKQETTKGLWARTTSQLTESFMSGYELVEPVIRSTLRDFLSKFNAPEFARGLAAIGQTLLNIFSVIGNIGNWIVRNFHWLEPVLFSGAVGVKLFKLAGALTNVGVALGFIGKQSVAGTGLQMITSLVGLGGGKMTFANKRAVVTALNAAGISGKGNLMTALLATGGTSAASILGKGAAGQLFASQVATGNGLIGAGASIAAIGTGAVAATAGIAALVGALGWVAYKTWKVKEAKDAVQEEIEANRKYRYPSIDALYESLNKTYKKAVDTKNAVDEVTKEKSIEEESGQKIGAFTGNWWTAFLSSFGSSSAMYGGMYGNSYKPYSYSDARQDDTRAAIITIAKKDSQSRINSAFAEFGKMTSAIEVNAFIQTAKERFGQKDETLDNNFWTMGKDGSLVYNKGLGKLAASDAVKMWDYYNYHNTVTVPEIVRAAEIYRSAISDNSGAMQLMQKGGFDFSALTKRGFYQDKNGNWVQKALAKSATDKEREDQLANFQLTHESLVRFAASLRNTFGGSTQAAENILKAAGFSSRLFSNEPDYNDTQPFNANRITNLPEEDDGLAGGNYSGTGKLSSAAPKQVIVNITNLLSVEAINLLKSGEGKSPEVQGLKEQLAQALIDVVHDFDASWNG